MSKRTLAGLFVLAAMAAPVMGQAAPEPAPAPQPQPQPQPQPGQPGQPGRGGRGQFDPEQFRQQRAARMKELLGCTDEEWAALSPKLEKVQTLQRATSMGRGGAGMLFGGGRGGEGGRRRGGGDGGAGGGTAAAPAENTSPVAQKARDLQASLENKEAKGEEIKAKLAALREARTKANADLKAAQEELRGLLTARQEGLLVVMGTLE